MAFLEFNNSIVVYGGRNDNKSKSSVLNDVFFLQVDTLTWINVDFKNKKNPSSRFSHACAIEGSKMIIFGGVGSKFGMEQSIEVIHFDPEDLNRNFTNILK
jgi:N-acetylneuraminic acid mutarotase